MIEGQEIEPIGTGVIHLIFGVISFDAKRACKLAEVDGQPATEWDYIRPICLEDVTINVRPWFVGRVPLKSLSSLPILKVEAETESFAVRRIGCVFDHQISLIQAEGITRDIIGAEKIDAPGRVVEIIAIISIEQKVDCCVM